MKKFAFLLIALMLVVTGCAAGGGGDTITVAGKPWTEQYILTHMMSEVIEAKTDLKVNRQDGLGETDVLHQAIVDGDIDVYADYTGTGLLVVLKDELRPDDTPEAIYDRVKSQYADKFNLTWMQPFGFNNTYALAMRKAHADDLGLTKVSDLKNVPGELVLGAPGSFYEREDGYDNMVKAYGLDFKDSVDMNESLMYSAVRDGEVDVITAFSTDGRIPRYDLKILEDDKRYFPPYYAVPIVRNEILEKYPEVGEALQLLGSILTDEKMQELNSQVDIDKKEPRDVAREFLQKEGIID